MDSISDPKNSTLSPHKSVINPFIQGTAKTHSKALGKSSKNPAPLLPPLENKTMKTK